MSSPGQRSGTNKAAELFEDLWRQLRECHQNALQELEAKVSKLKKERCLDAQRLEVFYSHNQQLKEQNKALQDAISLLEERLRAGECDRCAILEENLKNNQEQNLLLITKLKNERTSLQGENRKLHSELQKLKLSCLEPPHASSPEQEEGIIPDSPILPSSLPVANKLKKRKNIDKSKRVRYAELPLPQSNNSLFSEAIKETVDASESSGRAEVLVPNTCELETCQNDVHHDLDEAVAETCGLELLENRQIKTKSAAGWQSSSKSHWKNICLTPYWSSTSSTLIHSPDSTTERSPSLLPRIKRFSEDNSINKAKRKKEEIELKDQQDNKQGVWGQVKNWEDAEHIQPELSDQSSKKQPSESKVQSAQNDTSSQKLNASFASPALKKPLRMCKGEAEGAGKKRTPLQDLSSSHGQHETQDADRKQKVEPTWSIDPALALSMYDSEWRRDEEEEEEEEQCHGPLADTDCTWVSHSLLQRRGESSQDSLSGIGEKANDSLDMMFDTTAYGEYKSQNSSHMGRSQPCGDEEEEEDEAEHGYEEDSPENTPGHRGLRHPTFAHVAVVRKKDERRKLKGTTCKECEIYYAHLPEEEKQKKLSACSRHRFLYIPPSTPENFWEVGFPSTQTCIDRGYIKEEKNPQARSRRRQPFSALFSPKRNQQES